MASVLVRLARGHWLQLPQASAGFWMRRFPAAGATVIAPVPFAMQTKHPVHPSSRPRRPLDKTLAEKSLFSGTIRLHVHHRLQRDNVESQSTSGETGHEATQVLTQFHAECTMRQQRSALTSTTPRADSLAAYVIPLGQVSPSDSRTGPWPGRVQNTWPRSLPVCWLVDAGH